MKNTASKPESCNLNQVEYSLMNKDLTRLNSNLIISLNDKISSIFITRASILALDILKL